MDKTYRPLSYKVCVCKGETGELLKGSPLLVILGIVQSESVFHIKFSLAASFSVPKVPDSFYEADTSWGQQF